jgi:hypothetical protein
MAVDKDIFNININILDDTEEYEGVMFFRELPDASHPEIQRLMMELSNIEDTLNKEEVDYHVTENSLEINFQKYVKKKYPNVKKDITKLQNDDNLVYTVVEILVNHMFKTGVIQD